MESPDVYIPMDRRQAIVNNETLPSRTNGAALIADISGFTSLTAAMVEALGPKHGAGESTRQLNFIYEALIPQVHHYGGSVIGFGGDAITCWFDGDDGLRATGCALEMQQAMSRFEEIQTLSGTTTSMAIKVGIGAGAAHRFLVGDPQIQFLDVLAGSTLDRMAIAEKEATRGEILLGPLVANNLSEKVKVAGWRQVAETGDRLAVISALAEGVSPEKIPWPDLTTQDGTSALAEAQIRPWLLPPIYDRLAAGRGAFLAELRTTVTLFLRFEGIDYDLDSAAQDKLDAYIRWIQNTLARYEGYLIKLTIGDKGSYLLATFGAPLAHGDDAARAVAAALELQTPAATLEFITGTQIGLTQGRMLAGAFGSSTRSAYDVLGSEANLAARLMTKAESGQILISKHVAEAAGKEFRFDYLARVDIKGWPEPIPVFEVSDRRMTMPQRPTFLVGRENALNQLEKILNLVSAGQGQLLRIEGVAGVGKSHLTADLIELATNRNFQVAQAACQNNDSVNVYGPWRHIFRTWFDLTDEPLAGEDPAAWTARQVAQVEAVIEDINPDWLSLLPILADMLNLRVPDNETSMIVDPVLRQGILFALAIEMVKTWAKNQPSLILIDDAHWFDEASRRLSRAIARSIAKIPLLLAFVHRSPGSDQKPLLPELDALPYYNYLNLHGGSEPVQVHRPDREEQRTLHLQLQQKIIGRATERNILGSHLHTMFSGGEGRLVIIEGEAGIGKSRLVSHLLDQALILGITGLIGAGNAIENSTPYYAWRPIFSQLFDLDTRPGAKTTIKRTRTLSFLPADPELLRLVPLLNAVLPLGLQENEFTRQMAGQVRSDNTNELLVRLLETAVIQTPAVVILEDAQWLDSSSWSLTHLVCQRIRSLLVVVVTRPPPEPMPPEFQELLAGPQIERLRLDVLPPEDSVKLVCQRLGVENLPESLETLIRQKGGGHPFFSEELAYSLRDAGLIQIAEGKCQLASHVEDLDTSEIPDIIEGVIISRIDRLTPAHQLTLKVASVIGPEFSLAALQAVHPIEEDKPQLTSHLKAIERLDITRLETAEPELAYVFKTNLIQEVVYDLLPNRQQRDLHRAAAEWYRRSRGDDLTPLYPHLAYHYERAGDLKLAIDYLRKTGENAVQLGGFHDALNSLHHALDLLQPLPEDDDTLEQELNILITLGSALIALKGWGAPEVKSNYDRAWALCRRNGPTPQLGRVLFGLSTHHFFRGELRAAQELVKECLELADKLHHATLAVEAHLSLANIYFWLGNFTKNLFHYQQVIRLYDPSQNHTRAILYAQNPRLTCLMCSTWALCIMGYPEQALTQSQEVLTLAESLNHPLSGATAVQIGAWLHQQRREYKETQLLAEQLLQLTPQTEFPIYRTMGLALRGWALAHQERTAEGIAEIRAAMAILDKMGTLLGSTFGAMLLAEAYQQAGLVDEGLAVVSEALTNVEKREEASYAAELYRLQGELQLATSAAQSDAEAAFTKAVNIARQQQAKLFELRAVMGLSRMWQQQGKFIEAHSLLAVTYNQFTEGLSTPDLQSAADLLAELSS